MVEKRVAAPSWPGVAAPFAVLVALASEHASGKRTGSRLVAGAFRALISLGRPSLGVSGTEHMGGAWPVSGGRSAPVDRLHVGRRQPRQGSCGGLGAGGGGVN